MAKGKLWMVRHGESIGQMRKEAYDADGRHFLTPLGVSQAKAAGSYFRCAGIDFSRIYSSNLTRALQTTAVILHESDNWHRPWSSLASLNEIADPNDSAQITRVRTAFSDILAGWDEGNLLIVSHDRSMQVMFECLPVERRNIGARQGRHVENGAPFVWDPLDETAIRATDTATMELDPGSRPR